MIPETHPLNPFIAQAVQEGFNHEIVLRDPQVQNYVVSVLVDFLSSEKLFKIHNASDHPIEDVGEMLLHSDPIYGPAPSFDRERQVRKHIGDYVLFFMGMFPESINHQRLRRMRLENDLKFLETGKESYYVVSKFDHFEYAKVAPLFRKLARNFEHCVYGLNAVKNHLRGMQYSIIPHDTNIIM